MKSLQGCLVVPQRLSLPGKPGVKEDSVNVEDKQRPSMCVVLVHSKASPFILGIRAMKPYTVLRWISIRGVTVGCPSLHLRSYILVVDDAEGIRLKTDVLIGD